MLCDFIEVTIENNSIAASINFSNIHLRLWESAKFYCIEVQGNAVMLERPNVLCVMPVSSKSLVTVFR